MIRKSRMSPPSDITVRQFYGHDAKKGDVGIELEVEGRRLPTGEYVGLNTKNVWRYAVDHSLRGEENAEYVLRTPISFDEVPTAVASLWSLFASNESRLDDSNRTSVHIHLNVQEWYINRITSFAALFFSLEEFLVQWCGEYRVGNLFCLRAKDAPSLCIDLQQYIRRSMQYDLSDNLHYANLNFQALAKFGSLEVRAMRGVTDPEILITWVDILRRIYDQSKNFEDPRDVCNMFSAEGPLAYAEAILGSHFPRIARDIGWTDEQIRSSLYEGIRLAQDVIYSRDWSSFHKTAMVDDPFGRPPKPATPLDIVEINMPNFEAFLASMTTPNGNGNAF